MAAINTDCDCAAVWRCLPYSSDLWPPEVTYLGLNPPQSLPNHPIFGLTKRALRGLLEERSQNGFTGEARKNSFT